MYPLAIPGISALSQDISVLQEPQTKISLEQIVQDIDNGIVPCHPVNGLLIKIRLGEADTAATA
jgi:hypothetical protein